jgi:osmotically-inducible protein OsmY
MSEVQVEAEIRRALGLEPRVNGSEVRAQVVEGVATLVGVVSTLEEKEAAGRATARVAGVRQVENRLTVTANEPTNDRALVGAVESALQALPDEVRRTVGAVVEGGIVHLVGHARSVAAAEAAHRAAASVQGVAEIINEVQIDAGAPMDQASVINRVRQALTEAGLLTFNRIGVEAQGGEIILNGFAASPEDRERAEEVARRVAGVSRMENRLSVAEIPQSRPEGVTFR